MISLLFIWAFVVISPPTTKRPLDTKVSHATLALSSCFKIASKILSDTISQILSGCPSVTDSEVKNHPFFSSFFIFISSYIFLS